MVCFYFGPTYVGENNFFIIIRKQGLIVNKIFNNFELIENEKKRFGKRIKNFMGGKISKMKMRSKNRFWTCLNSFQIASLSLSMWKFI